MGCGLLAATLAALLYGLGPGVHTARAGAPQDWQAAQVAAVPAPTAVLYPTDVAPATARAATTPGAKSPQMVVDDQSAVAQTTVAQQQPTNVVVSIRIDSPGDNGPISQTNTAVGVANGTNDAATGQNGGPGGGGQNATTDQQAGGSTTVTQDGAGNLVVTVRINSPGNNGPISQTNAAVGSSNAQNSSETSQGGPSEAPVQQTAPAKRRPQHRSAAYAAPRQAAPAATTAPANPVAPAPSWHGSSATAAHAVRAHHPRKAADARTPRRRGTAAHRDAGEQLSASPLGKAITDAGNLLGSMAPRAPAGAAQGQADVSGSVLYSLLVVLAVAAGFVAWSLKPAWRRRRRFANWLVR